MLELELDNAKATLEDYDPKVGKVGGVRERSALLKVSIDVTADILAHFEATLKDRLFVLDEDLAGGVLRVRDSGEVYPMARSEEMFRATVKIDYGLGKPMHFPEADLDEFRISPMDGGGVILFARIKVKPDEGQAGRLYMLHGEPITLTVEPAVQPMLKEAA